MRFLKKYVAMPNALIDDTVMHYTAKVVYTAMSLSVRKSGTVKLTIAELVSLTGLCEETVLQAITELETGKFIKKARNWRYSSALNRIVYSSNTYKLHLNFTAGYTLISAKVFSLNITPATFCVLLFLYRCAGREGRAFPSIRYIAGSLKRIVGKGLHMSKSTVLRAIKELEKQQAFLKRHCEKQQGGFSNNSYYLTAMITKDTMKKRYIHSACQEQSPDESKSEGGFIFREASLINKITGVFIMSRKEKGVGQFGTIHKFIGNLRSTLTRLFRRPSAKNIP